MQVRQPPEGQATATAHAPAIWVTVSASSDLADLDPEVPIEFAGAGAREAFALASVLGESSTSVVVLEEPAACP